MGLKRALLLLKVLAGILASLATIVTAVEKIAALIV